jgi:hypothetical protein
LKNISKEISEKIRSIDGRSRISVKSNKINNDVSLYYKFLYEIVTREVYFQIWSRLTVPLRDQLYKKINE